MKTDQAQEELQKLVYLQNLDLRMYGLFAYSENGRIHFNNELKPAFEFFGITILESDQPDSFSVNKEEVYRPNSEDKDEGGKLIIDGYKRTVWLFDKPNAALIHN